MDNSWHRRETLRELEKQIRQNVVVAPSDSAERLYDVSQDTNNNDNVNETSSAATDVIQENSAVLKSPLRRSSDDSGVGVVDAMVDLLSGQTRADQREPSDGETSYTIPITRAAEPVVEWDTNGKLLAGAFPTLFLRGGDMLPKGSMPKHLVDHFCKYYDDRFEEDVVFVATLFNQKQRHAAVRKAAHASVTHSKALLKLAKLANDDGFKQQLLDAQSNPTSRSAKRLNAQLLRVLSIVGEPVPFSPFEIASARPKLAALSYRYGLAHHWVTLVPPEQDDIRLHRIAQLRKLKQWNQAECVYSRADCAWGDLPYELRRSPRMRLSVFAKFPALAAQMFTARLKNAIRDILRCD
ncbi:hypothetical protein PF010_g17962 [Phytophthora fragariae]|uniref:Uncharacterized protein n=1 Tax=Phytophthora fragariae TaxID=53985 RepID=A0A6G0KLJ3_9STRA|nr:hypothetical protein PF010_g17962 [Phytophthora fragariae]